MNNIFCWRVKKIVNSFCSLSSKVWKQKTAWQLQTLQLWEYNGKEMEKGRLKTNRDLKAKYKSYKNDVGVLFPNMC